MLVRTHSPRWRRLAAVVGALGAGAGAVAGANWYGCSVYDPSLLVYPDGGDGGSNADADADTGAPNPCPEDFPPDKPAADDPSDAGDQSFVVALHAIDIGLADGGPATLGYDLDRVFTCCDGGAESCKAAVTGATHCDQIDGRDNAAGELIASLASLDPTQFDTTTINQRLQSGMYSIIVQVLHYNGQPNDTQVTAALYASGGVEGDAGAAWNGQDSWTLDDSFVVSPDASPLLPTHFDANAYVSGGVLVMHVNFPISLGAVSSSSVTISLTAGLVTGVVTPVGDGTYRVASGQMAGRWNVSELLQALQSLYIGGQPVCRGSSTYDFIKSQICQHTDIMTDPTADKTGQTCDALSLGIGFTADPARIGAVVATTPKVSPCGDGGPPSPDQCP